MGPWLVAVIGALIVAAGLGVVIKTKWASNVPQDGKEGRYRLSWPVVGVGLIVLAVGIVLSVIHDHAGSASNNITNNNTNVVNVTGGNT